MRGAIIALVAAAAGCGTTSYQTARLLPAGHVRLQGAITRVDSVLSDQDGDDPRPVAPELMVRYGAARTVELGARWQRFGGTQGAGLNDVVVDGTVGVVPDRFAVSLGVGTFFSEGTAQDAADWGGFQVQPGVIVASPLSPSAELTGAAKLLLFFPDGDDQTTYWVLAVGLRLSPDLAQWSVHPEIGIADSDDLDGIALNVGCALGVDM